MKHHKAYKFRIYPNEDQRILFAKSFGSCRFVFNYMLKQWNDIFKATGKGLSYNECAKQLPALKADFVWLKEVDSIALQTAVRHVADGFDRFFKKQNQAPSFKSRKNPTQSFTTKMTNDNIKLDGHQIKLPKIGWMNFAKSREVDGRILSATVRRSPTGKYYVSLTCEVEIQPLPVASDDIGIDMGIKDYVVLSNGTSFANPKYVAKYEEKLAKWQKRMSRRKRGSKRYLQAKQKVALLHEKIAHCRTDFLQKLSAKLIHENQVICVESLSVKEMMKNPQLSKSISDASWSRFLNMLTYKATWYGRTLQKVDTHYPSSQLCHVCGTKKASLKDFSIRIWTCGTCHATHNRDQNASINILHEGLRLVASA